MDMRKTTDDNMGLPLKIIGAVTNILQSPGTENGKVRVPAVATA